MAEYEYCFAKLGDFAQYGLIVAIHGPIVRAMLRSNKQSTRDLIKRFNSHNDKLGFDFDNAKRRYKVGYSKQFNVSKYPDFLKQAAQFYSGHGRKDLADHFTAMAANFTITPKDMTKVLE